MAFTFVGMDLLKVSLVHFFTLCAESFYGNKLINKMFGAMLQKSS